MDATPKRSGALLRDAPTSRKLLRLPGAYHFAPIVQEFAAPPVRCCVVCDVPVENLNLGGHDAASALTGPLWCLLCADGRSPR